MSPHFIWQAASSGLPVHDLIQATLAMQLGLVAHLASSSLHCFSKQTPISFPLSVATDAAMASGIIADLKGNKRPASTFNSPVASNVYIGVTMRPQLMARPHAMDLNFSMKCRGLDPDSLEAPSLSLYNFIKLNGA